MTTQRTLLFSPATYNLAEVTRCIEAAKPCRDKFNVLFLGYGGDYEKEIEAAGFELRRLEPRLTPERIERIYKVDQGKKLGYYFTMEEARTQVENEIALFKEVRPVAVITGFNISNNVSCRVAKVPLVWLTHSTWLYDALIKQGLCTYPDMLDLPVVRLLGEKILLKLTAKFQNMFMFMFRPFTILAKQYGVPPVRTVDELFLGEYNLLAEPEDYCELKVPDTFHYIPPLIGRLDLPVPEEVANIPRDLPVVYFAMGSSGQPKVVAHVVESFAGRPYRVIAPVKSLIKGLPVKVPSNVLVTDWLPAHKVNPMADISVIHGGIGTVMTALLAGKPMVGVEPEQEVNIDCVVRKGFAIRIRRTRFTPEKLNSAIESLLNDDEAKRKAAAYQKVIEASMDPNAITDFFERTFPA